MSTGGFGGRPRKSQVEGQLVQVQKVLLSNSNRKELSITSKRDGSFGIVARLEICKLVRKLLPLAEKQGGSLGDVFTYLSDHAGRPKAKVKWAFENEVLWKKLKREGKLGAGTRGGRVLREFATPRVSL